MTMPASPPRVADQSLQVESYTIPLVAEQLEIQMRTVETGQVHISTRAVETVQVIDVPLQRDDVEVERVTINQVVERALPVRTEGDMTIISVYEERLVTSKQLVLVEEVRIRQRKSVQAGQPQHVTLRHEEVSITRNPAEPSV